LPDFKPLHYAGGIRFRQEELFMGCTTSRTLVRGLVLVILSANSLRAQEEAAQTPKVDEAAAAQLENCELYPLGVGREWTFKSGPLEIVERVTRHETVGDELCARVETVFGGKVVSYEHLAVRKDGVYRVAIAGKPVEPPLRFLLLPAEAGKTWKVDSKVVNQPIKGDFTLGKKPLKIGDEDLEAVVVEGANFKVGKGDLSFTYFFVPGVGKAKQIVTINDQNTTLELSELPRPGLAEPPQDARKL